MNTRQILIALVVLAVLLIIFALIAGPIKEKNGDDVAYVPERVVAMHSFQDGEHEYYGTVDLPTPCHTLGAEAVVRESFPEQVTLAFQAEKPEDDEVCSQVVTPTDWRVIFQASEDAVVEAIFNEEAVPLEVEETDEQEVNATTTPQE